MGIEKCCLCECRNSWASCLACNGNSSLSVNLLSKFQGFKIQTVSCLNSTSESKHILCHFCNKVWIEKSHFSFFWIVWICCTSCLGQQWFSQVMMIFNPPGDPSTTKCPWYCYTFWKELVLEWDSHSRPIDILQIKSQCTSKDYWV